MFEIARAYRKPQNHTKPDPGDGEFEKWKNKNEHQFPKKTKAGFCTVKVRTVLVKVQGYVYNKVKEG